jgi:hypothetical protein
MPASNREQQGIRENDHNDDVDQKFMSGYSATFRWWRNHRFIARVGAVILLILVYRNSSDYLDAIWRID